GVNQDSGFAVLESVLRVLYDAAPVFTRKKVIGTKHLFSEINAGITKHRSMRIDVDQGRFEIRSDHNPAAGEHLAASFLMIASAIYFGLDNFGNDQYLEA